MRKVKTIIGLGLFICISINLYSQDNSDKPVNNAEEKEIYERLMEPWIGKEFPVPKLTTIDNEVLSFSSLKGKVVYINLWFKNCAPCIAEMDGLNQLYEKHSGDDVVFIMITYENSNTVRKVVDQYNLKYKMVSVEKNELYGWGNVQGFPTHLVLGKEGKVVYGRVGGETDKEKATQAVLDYYGSVIESNLRN